MTVVVKLGSAIVSDVDGALRAPVLDRVCAQVASLHGGDERIVLVTSGSIATGRRMRGGAARPSAVDELQALSAIGQGPLYREYEHRLAADGVTSAQVLLTAFDMEVRRHYVNVRATLERLLDWDAVPVINENDTTATDEITFGDNDVLAAQVAVLLRARLLVLLTDISGLHTADPRHDPAAELIGEVDDFAALEKLQIGAQTGPWGTGGMRSKVSAARMATSAGTETIVCDGTVDGTLMAAATGDTVGTRFTARARSTSSFKLWLRHAKPPQGRLEIDEGAARVLLREGRSLLPVGVVEVSGDFAAGDAVEVSAGGRHLGKGIVNYSAAELGRIKGLKSAEVRELLPHASEEAIHRDELALED
ncbi:MAG: glutamate 5-kinase [Solirubrobacterales bacterium]